MKTINLTFLMATVIMTLSACSDDVVKKEATQTAPAKKTTTAITPPSAMAAKTMEIKTPSDVAAPPKNATVTASGLAYRVLKPGQGTVKPTATDKVTVHYSGWTTDGKMFDSSMKRNAPATFPLNRVIRGWTEAVGLMVIGEKTRFWIPEALAYQGRPGRPAGVLVFDIELISINK